MNEQKGRRGWERRKEMICDDRDCDCALDVNLDDSKIVVYSTPTPCLHESIFLVHK